METATSDLQLQEHDEPAQNPQDPEEQPTETPSESHGEVGSHEDSPLALEQDLSPVASASGMPFYTFNEEDDAIDWDEMEVTSGRPRWLPKNRTAVMAVLNLDPASFSGSLWETESAVYSQSHEAAAPTQDMIDAAVRWAEEALALGADVLDIGGESTRPGAPEIPEHVERERVIPIIEAIHQRFPEAIISIDTRKSSVAEAALLAGATVVNDVSGLRYDPKVARVVARHNGYLILTHSIGTPETMQANPHYPQGVVRAVTLFFHQQLIHCWNAGIPSHRIILDPGIGFGKSVEDNIRLLKDLFQICQLGHAVMIGTSRKSFLNVEGLQGRGDVPPQGREALTAASLAVATGQGVSMVRIHDVKTQVPVIRWLDYMNTVQP